MYDNIIYYKKNCFLVESRECPSQQLTTCYSAVVQIKTCRKVSIILVRFTSEF